MKRRTVVTLLIFAMLFALLPTRAFAAPHGQSYDAELIFSDGAITEAVSGEGYSVSGTALSIKAAGTYRIGGSCADGSIAVAKNLSDVVLVLDDLTLASSDTAPLVVKKSSNVTVHVSGTVTLTDNEDPAAEDSADADIADAFEGAVIKVKSGSTVTFCGSGALTLCGNAKNGIKGGATSALVFADSATTYRITAANNAVAADGSVTVYGGTFDIDAENDGIKSVPDETDADSLGAVLIYGGSFDIDVNGDGIQAETDLVIRNGYFEIDTFEGYNVSGTKYWNVVNGKDKDTSGTFDAETMSCKGIKLSGDREKANELFISGGTFILNTSDDAIHSDMYAVITGGTFRIRSGDDGIHADSALTLGTEGGYDRDPDVTIEYCYEGLEAANEYIYSGKYHIYAVDDGINAAGGSDGSSDGFVPGGPGHRFGWGGGEPGSRGDYSLEIAGGYVYVNCLGDGLDSNGALKLTGGEITVFSKAGGGDDSPLDADGEITVNGATVCAAGGAGVDGMLSSREFGQNYYQSSLNLNANTIFNVTCNDSVVYSDTLPRKITYFLYSSPEMTGNSATVASVTAVTPCKSNRWAHSWGDCLTVTAATSEANGVGKYVCADCGVTEYVTLVSEAVYSCGSAADVPDPTEPDIDPTTPTDEPIEPTEPTEYSITAVANNDSYGTVTLLDNIISAAPASGYQVTGYSLEPSDGATVTRYGNLFVVDNLTADVTVTILFEAVEQTEPTVPGEPPVESGEPPRPPVAPGESDEPPAKPTDPSDAPVEPTEPTEEHTHSYTAVVTAPTCTEKGYTTYTCACGESYRGNFTDTIDHDYIVTITLAPTATEAGERTYTCSVCGKSYTEVIPATGVESTEPSVEPEEPCDGDKDCPGYDFTDMPAASDWAHEGIDYAIKNGLMNGMGNNKFEPETSMTRAMLVTVLWRNAGSPKEGKNTFTDVKNGEWYTDAIAWAAANGIVNGMGNNTFEPDTEITREQMATILYRYANLLKIDTSARAELKNFKDASDVNDWAKEAVQWAVASGVITGSKEPDGTYLFPQNPATRAQVATMLMRYLETVIG